MKRKLVIALLCVCSMSSLIGCGKTSVTPELSGEDVIDMEYQEETEMSEFESEDTEGEGVVSEQIEYGDDILTSYSSMLQKSASIVDTVTSEENIMYSPLSLNLALGLITNGMSDDGRAFMASYFGEDISDYNVFVKKYMANLPETVEIANGLFVDGKFTVNTDTQKLLMSEYGATFDTLDFMNQDSVSFVNNWCSENTHGMIPKLVDDLSGYSMVAANALYFKDAWLNPVSDTSVDENGTFYALDGSEQTCAMMHFTEGGYLENDNATGFVKPYANSQYGFVAILPKADGDFKLADLDIDSLMASESFGADVIASMPEFSFDNSMSLSDTLIALGLENLFTEPYCDKLLNEDLAIVDEIIQKTKVDVNREGTEAAAVTGIMMRNTAFMPDNEHFVTIDRPFAFMIYDFDNDMPLFMGKVVSIK